MKSKLSLIALVAVLGVVAGWPGTAEAQRCGLICVQSYNGGYGGGYESSGAWYGWGCVPNDCSFCTLSARDSSASDGAQVLEEIVASDPASVRAIAANLGDRLLVHETRNLVVYRGTACNDLALSAVAFVPAATAKLLRDIGVSSLREFVQAQAAAEAVATT